MHSLVHKRDLIFLTVIIRSYLKAIHTFIIAKNYFDNFNALQVKLTLLCLMIDRQK